MLDEQRLFAHVQRLVADFVVQVMNLAAAQRVAVEQIHVEQHRQRVLVGFAPGQLALRVVFGQVAGHHDFGGDEVGRADHIRRVFARHHQAVHVNHAGVAPGGIDQHVFIRQVGMGQAHHVHLLDGSGNQQAHFQVIEPVAQLARIHEAAAVAGRGKPFALFFPALDTQRVAAFRAELHEKMRRIGGRDQPQFALVLQRGAGPAKQVFPVIAAALVEQAVAVFAGDHLQAVFGLRILRGFEKCHHIGFVRRKIDILHGPGANHFVHVFDQLPVKRAALNQLGHQALLLKTSIRASQAATTARQSCGHRGAPV